MKHDFNVMELNYQIESDCWNEKITVLKMSQNTGLNMCEQRPIPQVYAERRSEAQAGQAFGVRESKTDNAGDNECSALA